MNFIAIIGIVHKIITKEKDPFTTIKIKVEKPFVENKDDKWYELVDAKMNRSLFKNEIRLMSEGAIVGIKGRLQTLPNGTQTIAERVQLF